MTRRLLSCVPAIAVALLGFGCGGDLPLRERVVSTRPLAVRVEVVESTDPDTPVRAEALPTERVRLVPWIVGPTGPLSEAALQEIDPVWLACPLRPIEGVFACLSARLPLEASEIADCPEPSLAGLGSDGPGELPSAPSPCRITGGTAARPELVVPLDPSFIVGGDLEVTMIGHVPGLGSTAECLDHLLARPDAFSDACLYVTQRVPVGPHALLLQLALDLGLATPEQLGPIPDTIPDPDANPRIVSFSVSAEDEAGTALGTFEVARGDVLELPAGARLEITTEAPASDLQTFLVPRDDTFVEREETYSGQWFRTWGRLLSPSSNDPVSLNTWTLEPGPQDEDASPPSGRATLYYVLRDSRSGVDWWWFHVDVTGEP